MDNLIYRILFEPEPRWKLPPKSFILAVLLAIILVFFIFFGVANAEEPNWDKVIDCVIIVESSGNPNAISQDGCRGLMQVSEIVLEEFNKRPPDNLFQYIPYSDLFLPTLNCEVGTWYLKRIWYHYLPHYKLDQNLQNLCYAYNMGIGNLVKYRQGKIKLPKEARDYYTKFMRLYK